MNVEHITQSVCELAIEVGDFIRGERLSFQNSQIEIKGKNDFVSYVDRTAEQKIVEILKKIIPEAGFIVEENTEKKRGEKYNWIVDPLDGTTNFIHGMPCYSISIALMEDDEIISGVVYEINMHEIFYASKGCQAKMNEKNIEVTKIHLLKDSLLATGFPYHDYGRLNEYMQVFDYCLKNTHGLRRLGSAAVDLVYVACGRLEGFFEYGLNPWDVAAGAFIVQQAGGKVADFSGDKNYCFGKEIIATNSLIYEEFLKIIKDKMLNNL